MSNLEGGSSLPVNDGLSPTNVVVNNGQATGGVPTPGGIDSPINVAVNAGCERSALRSDNSNEAEETLRDYSERDVVPIETHGDPVIVVSQSPVLTFGEWCKAKKVKGTAANRRKYNLERRSSEERAAELIRRQEQSRLRRHARIDASRNESLAAINRVIEENGRVDSDLRGDVAMHIIQEANNVDIEMTEQESENDAGLNVNLERILQQFRERSKNHRHNRRNRVATNFVTIMVSAVVYAFRLGPMTFPCSSCGSLHFRSERVKGKSTFNHCCNHGKVTVNLSYPYPPELKELLMRRSVRSNEFHENILKYNSAFGFGITQFNRRYMGPGVFHLNIQGPLNTILPRYTVPLADDNPTFGQLYVVETRDAMTCREQTPFTRHCNKDTMTFLHNLIGGTNKYALMYRRLHEIEKDEEDEALRLGQTPKTSFIMFRQITTNTSSPFALPVEGNEVAGIYFETENGSVPRNAIRVQARCPPGEIPMNQTIEKNSEHIEPMMFVLFYPTGLGDFWHIERSMTVMQYYTFKLSVRPMGGGYSFNPVLYGGKLLSKYLIHAFCVVEDERLKFVRLNQKSFRIDTYSGLKDYLATEASERNVLPGRMIVLPSTYTQGPRCQSERFHDAMATVRKHGKPHLFITMTCNVNHPDIKANLLEHQTPVDRPDLIDIVFNEQVKKLVDVMKSGVFGNLKHYIYVIEFQKRGLPHVHSVWTFEEDDWNDISKIDTFISAEFPDPEVDREGYELVKQFMVHNYCGEDHPEAVCMKNNCCKRGFPKAFQEETTLDENSYPSYRRRETGIHYTTRVNRVDRVIDNRRVVPYNMFLLKLFLCHLNVEVISCLNVVTYLHKYLFKGPDKIAIEIRDGHADYDEVKAYLHARYLGAHEAYWRLRSFTMYYNNNSIERLPVHLNEQQTIALHNDVTITDTIQAMLKKSKLLACFELNRNDPNGVCSQLTYVELPSHYTWDSKQHEWHRRLKTTKQKCPRMYAVDPKKSEMFYLRKLLMIVKGPRSYEHLRTDPNDVSIVHPTFREACVARNLVRSDEMYIDALREGVLHCTAKSLRSLFARIVAHCDVESPLRMFEMFQDAMCADYLRRRISVEAAVRHAWRKILRMIMHNDRSLSDYRELEIIAEEFGVADVSLDVDEHYVRGISMEANLNVEQKSAYEAIMGKVNSSNNDAACFFINGPGGSGKSYLLNCAYNVIVGSNKKMIIMAWSGIAASLYSIGRTCHNVFKLDYPFDEESNSGVKPGDALSKDLFDAHVIVLDEAPMAPRHALEIMNIKLKEVMNNDIPFGGKVMILAGDFCQLPPVVPHGTESDIFRNSIRSSPLWEMYFAHNVFNLSRNQRADENGTSFAEDILNIGNASGNCDVNRVVIPVECFSNQDLIQGIFGDEDGNGMYSKAILCTLNKQVDDYNGKVLDLLDSTTEHVYEAYDQIDSPVGSEHYCPEYLETFRPTGFPEYRQRYRVGATVMLIRNLNIREGLCNGTRLRVCKLTNNLIICKKLSGIEDQSASNEVCIPRITLKEESTVFTVYRTQFPLRLAFAMTINKSQGQTFEKIGIDLTSRIFCHGHLYVALSRTRNWDRIHIKHADEGNVTDNIVFSNLLL